MNFAQLIDDNNGQESLHVVGNLFSLDETESSNIVTELSPVFVEALNNWAGSSAGKAKLNRLVYSGGPQQFIDRPMLLAASACAVDGDAYLRLLFEDDAQIKAAAEQLSSSTSISKDKAARILPVLACTFIGVLCKALEPRLSKSTAFNTGAA